jgi:hypothetical protein
MSRASNPYPTIKAEIPVMAKLLLDLPPSHVWIHEKVLHKYLGAPRGSSFGPYHSLTCVLGGIEKGYVGNKRKVHVQTGFRAFPDFSRENSEHSVSYQEFGKPESFVGGKLALSQPLQKPRWFKSGVTLCDISTQLEIVDALIGREPELAENAIDRREKNYVNFFKEVDNDGGYQKIDVPMIAY